MKTIFVPLYHGYTARNFFYTDVFKTLTAQSDVKIVVFTSKLKSQYYRGRFGSEKVIIEEVEPSSESSFQKSFAHLCFYSSPLRSTYLQIRRYYITDHNPVKLISRLFVNQILARIKPYRLLLRWIDKKFLTGNYFGGYFQKYRPDLVYLPHFISPMDIELSKEAKKRKIFRVGLVNSWDNVSSRGLCRNLPDKMIAHNKIVEDQLVKYHDYQRANIFTSGIPQFDLYFTGKVSTREQFFNRIKVNPSKKLILFCPVGERFSKTEWQAVTIIDQAITDGRLPADLHILVRNNPVIDIYLGELKENENVTVEYPAKRFPGGKMNDWEFEEEQIQHLADTLYYSEMYVGCASTMVIDISAYNRPLIGIAFDGWENLGFYRGVKWTFTSTHFKAIVATGGITLAKSENKLIDWIKRYLADPKINYQNRRKIIEEQYGNNLDGLAGKRVGEFILKCLEHR